jgi:tRNA modification GTPase
MAGTGLDALRATIATRLMGQDPHADPPAITNLRHIALVETARDAVAEAERSLAAGATEELVLVDLERGRTALEDITGRRTPDDLLAHIFARFCVGK